MKMEKKREDSKRSWGRSHVIERDKDLKFKKFFPFRS